MSLGIRRWLLLPALVAGCAKAEVPADPISRGGLELEMHPVETGASPQAETRQTLIGQDLFSLLEISAKRTRLTEEPEPAVPAPFGAALAWDPKHVRMELRGPFDPSSFDAIELRGQAWNDAVLGLHLLRDGQIVRAGTRLAIRGTAEVREWAFEFPGLAHETKALDAIALVFASDRKLQVGLSEVTFVQRAPLGELLLAEETGTSIVLGTEGRHAKGLGLGRALESPIPAGAQGRLQIQLGLPESALSDSSSELIGVMISLSGEGFRHRWQFIPRSAGYWMQWEHELPVVPRSPMTLRLEAVGAGAHVAIAVGSVRLLPPRPEQDPPLVLLITSDTHRADHVGYAPGAAPVKTPALDRLAARGVSFLDCWASINVTNPSHATLFTGLSPRDTGVVDNTTPLAEQADTLAEAFAAAGFDTWAAVSVPHLAAERSGLGQGFGRYSAPLERDRSGAETISVLEEWLKVPADRPRFVWLHLFDVHAPYEPPADLREEPLDRDREMFAGGVPSGQLPGWARGKDALQLLADYRGEVRGLDRTLGAFLERSDVSKAILAFTADHGEALGGHSIWFDHRGLYPGTLAVPLILAGPGVPEGQRVSRRVTHHGLASTLLGLAGVATDLPGTNLLEQLSDTSEEPARFYLAGHGLAGAVRSGEHLLVLNLKEHPEARGLPPLPKHQLRLFHLESDPHCRIDVSGEQPQMVQRLRAGLVRWLQAGPEQRLAGQREVRAAAELEELRRLGYAAGDDAPASAWFDPACSCKYCEPFAD